MNVKFTGLIDAPPSVTQSILTGLEKSKYGGLGPIFGSNFSVSIFKSLSLQGTFGGGIFLGNIKSSINAVEANDQNSTTTTTTFNAAECNFRAMPLIKGQLAFAFHPSKKPNVDCELKVGYEIDYYFNVIDRINPFNGFVINQNPFPVKKSSHLSLGGPFINLSIRNSDSSYYDYSNDWDKQYHSRFCNYFYNLYGEFTSSWLKPISNNNDLVYAVLNTADGCKKNQKASSNHSWNGTYKLGYQTFHDCDFNITFFRLNDQSSTQVAATNGESISSVNASGSSSVTYSAAQSKVTYNVNQGEFLVGKWFSPLCRLQMLLSCGLRYASLKRRIQNQYTGGVPPENFESKFNCLKNNYRGAGPVFSMQPRYSLIEHLQLTGYLATSLLMGHVKSTLDQVNTGTVEDSSNTLRTPNIRLAIPIVDARAGFSYKFCCFSKINLNIEAGYQFSEYFKAINLLFPNFLTGLQQNNSDLKLHGPYLNIKLGFNY